MPFLLAFTLFALLDFVILFSVGSQIGLLTTLLLVLATGFIGLHLIRREGAATFARARERLERGEVPSGELLTGAALIFGGALLMAPGFVSDALGFMCLIPDARRLLGKLIARLGIRAQGIHVGGGHGDGPRQGHDADWQQASGSRRPYDARDASSSHGDDQDGPLEGEFISGDDRRR
ncbi:FxsA family protein [Halomonas sp. HK25]|uniref:FxsA family protein n=1 Tax=Halomonas sp. HK25 TaxID=3394321 RepID=UPI0039FD4D7A